MDSVELGEFRRSIRKLERQVAGQLKEEIRCCGVTTAQCHTLLEIKDRGQASVKDLAASFGLDNSTLSQTIDGLVNTGLLSRVENPDDRRFIIVELTEQGAETAKRINTLCNSDYLHLFNYIPREKHAQIVESLTLLTEAMSRYMETRELPGNKGA